MYLSLYSIIFLTLIISSFRIPNLKSSNFRLKNIFSKQIKSNNFRLKNKTIHYNFGIYPRLDCPNSNGELTWYPIGFPEEFNNRHTKKITIRDINYIIWKDSNVYYAIRDACSHQGSSFQGGCINADTIKCPYHGYIFSGSNGTLVDIPDLEICNS